MSTSTSPFPFPFPQFGRCRDCRYWDAYRHHECEAPQDDGPAGFTVRATATDDSGLEAWIQTGPDFGGPRFQPKTQP